MKIKWIPRNLEKIIPLSQTLIRVCSDIEMISCSWLFPVCNFFSWYRFFVFWGFFLLPDVVKLIAQSLVYYKIWIKNTGYTWVYNAAQNEGNWSSEKGNLYIVPELKFFGILQTDAVFCRGEIFSSGWKLLWAFSVHRLQEQHNPRWKVMLTSEGSYKYKHI